MPAVWMELRTNTLAASKAFYESSMGWTAEPTPIGSKVYWRFRDNTTQLIEAGMCEDSTRSTAAWIGYIWVDEPDSVVTAATGLGATLLAQGAAHPLRGSWARLRDPELAVYGVYNGDPFS